MDLESKKLLASKLKFPNRRSVQSWAKQCDTEWIFWFTTDRDLLATFEVRFDTEENKNRALQIAKDNSGEVIE